LSLNSSVIELCPTTGGSARGRETVALRQAA